jgi:hypothetical protein
MPLASAASSASGRCEGLLVHERGSRNLGDILVCMMACGASEAKNGHGFLRAHATRYPNFILYLSFTFAKILAQA